MTAMNYKPNPFACRLERAKACSPATLWVRQNGHTLESAWKHCDYPPWMWWLLQEQRTHQAVADAMLPVCLGALKYHTNPPYALRQLRDVRWRDRLAGSPQAGAVHLARDIVWYSAVPRVVEVNLLCKHVPVAALQAQWGVK